MLTKNQRDAFQKIKGKLSVKDGGLNPKQRGDFYYRMSKILKDELEGLEDLAFLLDEVPSSYLEKIEFQKIALSAMELTERLIEKIDPWPVGMHEDGVESAFRVWGSAIPACAPGKCTIDSASRTATEEEIDLHNRLKDHLNKVRFYVDPCIPDPVCRDPAYTKALMDRFIQIKQTAQKPFSFSLNAYTDEVGVNESGWVLREPTMISIDQLRWMRWKPRGLKECLEMPPLIAPKEIPRGREIMRLSIRSNENGTQFLVSEDGGEARSVPIEEFLKYQKKFGMEEDIKPKEAIDHTGEQAKSGPVDESKEGPQ